ncbi:MAG TPA: hypothetical protein VH595_01555 [Verrucomicrobiae bacterium]|jgi:hypothetical protein|nr:hypothetical protein [Verrucomicrobiae bacterium]
MAVQFIQAVGAGASWDWVTLLDNVSVTYLTSGVTNVLAPEIQNGAIFTAIVETNGAPATAATGTVLFETNTVTQSSGPVSGGMARRLGHRPQLLQHKRNYRPHHYYQRK